MVTAGGIAVIAANRLLKFLRDGKVGTVMRVGSGKEKVCLAPKEVAEKVKDIPRLPEIHTATSEAEGLSILINHFDPIHHLEDQLYSKSMIYGLEIGLRDFTHHLEHVQLL